MTLWPVVNVTLTQVLGTIVVVLMIRICIHRIQKYAFINRLPGPFALPLVGNLWIYYYYGYYRQDAMKFLSIMAEKYGEIFRFWAGPSPFVFLTAPQHMKIFFTSTTMVDKSHHYTTYAIDLLGSGLPLSDGARWKNLRKMFLTYFNTTPVETLKTNFFIGSMELVSKFKQKADGPFFNSGHMIQCTASNTIFRNACGETIPEAEEESLIAAIDEALKLISIRGLQIINYNGFIYKLTPNGKIYHRAISCINAFVKRLVVKKKKQLLDLKAKGSTVPNLYIYKMLANHDDETLHLFINEMKSLMVAGQDTSAKTISYILTLLALYPEVQEKVYQEDQQIQKHVGKKRNGVDDIEQYQYLQRVIKETLRLFPVAPFISRTLGEDTYFENYLLKKGTEVAVIFGAANHNPKIFRDPGRFDPNRFLPENMTEMPPYAFNPFSAGPRGCPGMRYSMMEMKIIVPAVVRQFRIISKYNNLQEVEDNVVSGLFPTDKEDFPIRLVTRV